LLASPADYGTVTSDGAARWAKVQELFAAALEKAPASRAEFLATACSGDAALRSEVETLLAANDEAGDFLATGSTAAASQQRLEPGTRLGPYEIVALLGAGGMGEVYRAMDVRLGREVAIKALAIGSRREDALRRFDLEARAASALNHPNILQVYDIGVHQGSPYIVSELLHGRTLRDELQGGRLPLRKALDYALQLAEGIRAAHGKGIIHRDLKPENLFVTSDGRLKILDFGIAKLVPDGSAARGEGRTRTGTILGTVAYMAPEQLRGEGADRRSDIFSFGAILYEMLAGEQAFARDSAFETAHAIVHDDPPALPGAIPADVERTVLRCLRKDAAARFQSADDLAIQLTAPSGPAPRQQASVWAELKRRRVVRALVGYGIAAFAILQIIEPIIHGLHWPDAILSYVVVALAVGFPIVVSLSWILDTNAGAENAPARVAPRGPRLAILLVGIGALAAAPGIIWYFVVRERPGAARQATPAAGESRSSIAVLAFVDMSPGKDQEYFSDGIAEEILNALAQVEGLRVIGRTSSFSFKGKDTDLRTIGRALDVKTILEGSVRKAGDRIRITTQLINATDGAHLWSETYDRKLTDVFAAQDEIAKSVATALRIRLLPAKQAARADARRPTKMEAYGDYLLGNYFLNRYSNADIPRAVESYERAIAIDPAYASAHAGLSRALIAVMSLNTSGALDRTTVERSRKAAEEAVALAPDLSEGYAARGTVRLRLWDWVGAKTDLERALALNSGDVIAQLGRIADAISWSRRASSLDPLNTQAWNTLGNFLLSADEFDSARIAYQRALEISPEHTYAVGNLISLQIREGHARAALQSVERLGPDYPLRLFYIALAQHALGNTQASQDALDAMIAGARPGASNPIAVVCAWRGQLDRAFQWLDRAYADRERPLNLIKSNRFLRDLRGDPRYTALLRKMNLPLD
jgi:serine/threonine-protein kinase